MNVIVRERTFREGRATLVREIRERVQAGVEPLATLFLLVHRSSSNAHAELIAAGGATVGGGFALNTGRRHMVDGGKVEALPPDTVACMVHVGGELRTFGVPLAELRP